jgi:hypothetical protein
MREEHESPHATAAIASASGHQRLRLLDSAVGASAQAPSLGSAGFEENGLIGAGSVLHQPVPGVRVVDIDGQARGRELERAHDRLASIEQSGLGPDGDPRDGGRPTTYPKVAALAYEDDRPDAVSPPTEPSVPARLATSSGFGASRRRTASASCAGDSPVRAAFARSRSSRFSRRRCLADCFSPNNVSRLEVDPQLNRPDRCNSRSS